MTGLPQDLRFALRMVRREPVATVVAVATLALSIGATSAMFSLVNSVVIRPLPYAAPEQLVEVRLQAPGLKIEKLELADNEYFFFAREKHLFDSLAAYSTSESNLTGIEPPERIGLASVSASLFRVLGVTPLFGRVFTPDEDRPGRTGSAILSYSYWRRRFGADPHVLGVTVRLNGVPHTVVAVMRPDFQMPSRDIGIWVPLGLNPANPNPREHDLSAVGRLAPGMTVPRSEAESGMAIGELSRIYPRAYPSAQLKKTGLKLQVIPLHDYVVGEARRSLLILFGSVGFVLAICCVNTANFLLARAESRRKEIAMRVALGARWPRILRQLLTESTLLGLAGAAIGLGLAVLDIRLVLLLHPANLPRAEEMRLDLPVSAFTLSG
jgi:putative ABC transport system permease protein